MQRKLSLYPDKETSLEPKGKTTTSSEGSSSIQRESLQYPLEVSPPNTKDTRKCLVKKSRRDYPNIPFGITPSSCSQGHLPRYQDDSSLSPKVKSLKHKNS